MRRCLSALLVAAFAAFAACPAVAQQAQTEGAAVVAAAPILTVDLNQLFARSAWGTRAQAELEAEGRKIAADHERIAAQLSEEEARLTEQRKTLDPADFRKLAEAFDVRATEIRRARAQVVDDLNARVEADRAAFYQAALPVMAEVMRERNAVAVLERRTVFVSLDAIDITDALIERLDETIGEGPAETGAGPSDTAPAIPAPAAPEAPAN
ncbi:OmpH family outer membrane protein [Paracoccus sp. (in: a-proteobacteria)]|uniref:OmpH family outer membrane protein n=1 Tax=Paracoccus sp. TaxID=267 RepID=UPI003A899623